MRKISYLKFSSKVGFVLAASLNSLVARAGVVDGTPSVVDARQHSFVIDGQYRILHGGTIRWFRLPLEAWRDTLRIDGIEKTLTTCPADGKACGAADVAGVIPIANVCSGFGGEKPEKIVFDLLDALGAIEGRNGICTQIKNGRQACAFKWYRKLAVIFKKRNLNNLTYNSLIT